MNRVAAEATDRVDLAGLVARDLAARVGPADLVITDPVDPVGLAVPVTMDLAAPADLVTTDLAARVITDLVGPATTDPAVPATTDPAAPATTDLAALDSTAPADLVVRGTATTSAATSTAPRGATDLHLGVLASRRIPTGAGRFLRPVEGGTTARSTTTAITRTPCGTRGSTSGDSTSSESGFRCKESPSRDARFADRRSGRCSSST